MLIVGLALGAISVAAVRLARIRPFLLVGWCWYLGTLVPVIGLVQVGMQSMADRYTYIPLIGIFIIAAWGAAEFTEDWPARNKAVAAAVVLAVCGWLTWRQVATWSSSEALYGHAVEAERYNFFALHGLGMAYWKDGKLDEAQTTIRDHAEHQIRSEYPLERWFGAGPSGLGAAVGRAASTEEGIGAVRCGDQEPSATARAAPPQGLDSGHVAGRKRPRRATAVECAKQALEKSPGNSLNTGIRWPPLRPRPGSSMMRSNRRKKPSGRPEPWRADDLIPGIQQRLELFQSGMPYHVEAQAPVETVGCTHHAPP